MDLITEKTLPTEVFADLIFNNWKSRFTYDERIFLNLKNDLKLRIDREYDRMNSSVKYDGVLFINISKDEDDEDWRVATAIIKDGGFKCTGEDELFTNITTILEKIKHYSITFKKYINGKEEDFEICFKKINKEELCS